MTIFTNISRKSNQQLNPEDEQYKQQNEYLLAKIARLKLASIPTFDCIFLGDSGVGKKSFLERHKIGVINKKDNMYPIEFFTNRGAIRFRVLNASHLQQYEDICSYYKYVKCAIIMFDVSRAETFNNVSHWLNRFTKPTPDFPIVLCGNKADIRPHNVGTKDIVAIERSDNLPFNYVSALTNYNYTNPFLVLARKLLGSHIEFFTTPELLVSPEIEMPSEWRQQIESELKEARESIPVPMDESDNPIN